MDAEKRAEILNLLDFERRTVIYPGVTRFSEGGVVRDVSNDGKDAEIVYSSCSPSDIDRVIEQQKEAAQKAGYELEWKVYGHDRPHNLRERLTAAGFEAGDREKFMVFVASPESLAHFGENTADIRRITHRDGLKHYQIIWEEVSGKNCEGGMEKYAHLLENHPNHLSLYVAYADNEPAACGRIYFHENSKFAVLYGGSTRARWRKRGLFTQIVAVRIKEAVRRGITNLCVDALPTSEPILSKRGFEVVTETQPFRFPV